MLFNFSYTKVSPDLKSQASIYNASQKTLHPQKPQNLRTNTTLTTASYRLNLNLKARRITVKQLKSQLIGHQLPLQSTSKPSFAHNSTKRLTNELRPVSRALKLPQTRRPFANLHWPLPIFNVIGLFHPSDLKSLTSLIHTDYPISRGLTKWRSLAQ